MCTALFELVQKDGDEMQLIVAHNRDESYERKTARMHLWQHTNGVEILARMEIILFVLEI